VSRSAPLSLYYFLLFLKNGEQPFLKNSSNKKKSKKLENKKFAAVTLA
jgi:hypothetical protein